MPVPLPPRMKLGRTMIGYPTSSAIVTASSSEWAKPDRGTSSPISCIASLNSSRSSAVRIASGRAPITSSPSSAPCSSSAIVRLSAVWPPSVGSSASGRSRSMIAASISGSSGSTYVRSAVPGSVMIVAGFELARTTR